MKMKDLEISKGIKIDIESNQNQLKNAIRNHQIIVVKLKAEPDNVDIQKKLHKAEEEILLIGLKQKSILERLREEYKAQQKCLKSTLIKNGVEERKQQLGSALSRARKQNIVARSDSVSSFSEDSIDSYSAPSSPEYPRPSLPHDLSQCEFLTYFGLGTHEVFKELQNKRAERKRRSTASSHFLYGNKGGWDYMSNKRKRGGYLISAVSPPHTRQSTKRKPNEKSPPTASTSQQSAPQPRSQNPSYVRQIVRDRELPSTSTDTHTSRTDMSLSDLIANKPIANGLDAKPIYSSFPTIPNLPSGLVIERVRTASSSSDPRTCIKCKETGIMPVCENCSNGFHINCHNRPLIQTPRQCPKCLSKDIRTVGSLNVPSGMTVSYVHSATSSPLSSASSVGSSSGDVSEKLRERRILEEKNKSLNLELEMLQNKHSQLTISLKTQKSHQEQLLMTQHSTEDKIKEILTFMSKVKGNKDLAEKEFDNS